MRTLVKNKTRLFYAVYSHKTPVVDEYGNQTGEYQLHYCPPMSLAANISAGTGQDLQQPFGLTEHYDRVLLLDHLPSGFDQATRLWIDFINTERPHDYIVKKIIPSLNCVTVGVSKVTVSA